MEKQLISDAEFERQMAAAEKFARKHPEHTPEALDVFYDTNFFHRAAVPIGQTVLIFSGWALNFDARRITELAAADEDDLKDVKLIGKHLIEWTKLDVHISVAAVIVLAVGEDFIRRESQSRRGSVKSARKAASSKANGAKSGGRPPKVKAAEVLS